MNEFTGKNEQAFLDACGAIGVEPSGMVNTLKERYLVVANGIDRMISEGAPVGQTKVFFRAKHFKAPSDTAFGS